MANFFTDGDFRSALGATFNPSAASAIGTYWTTAGHAGSGGGARGVYSGTVYSEHSWLGLSLPPLPDSALQGVAALTLTSPQALSAGTFGAQLAQQIPNGTRIFNGSILKLSFWVYSTSRLVSVDVLENFGTGSATANRYLNGMLLTVTPNQWEYVRADIICPLLLSTDDLRGGDYLQILVGIDNVTPGLAAGNYSSFTLNMVETSTAPTPMTAVTGFNLDQAALVRVIPYVAPVTTSGGGGGGSFTPGNLAETGSSVLTVTGGANAVNGGGTTIQVKQATTSQSGYLSNTDWNTFNTKLSALTTGNVTEATSAVLTITGGTAAVIGSGLTIQVLKASAGQSGYLAQADWSTFNSKQSTLTFGNVTEATSAVLTITGGTAAIIGTGTTIQVKQATTSQSGYLSSTDWTTFNNKLSSFTSGNLTEATSSVLTFTGNSGAVVGSGTTIQVKQATTSQSGYLSNTDWNTFNGKQAAVTNTQGGTNWGIFPLAHDNPITGLDVPSYSGQWGISANGYLWLSTGITAGAWTPAVFNPAGGISSIGLATASTGGAGTVNNMSWYFNSPPVNQTSATSGADSNICAINVNPYQSGSGFSVAMVSKTNTGGNLLLSTNSNSENIYLNDLVAGSFLAAGPNCSLASDLPSCIQLMGHSIYPLVLVNSSGSGNYSYSFMDGTGGLSHFPKWVTSAWSPLVNTGANVVSGNYSGGGSAIFTVVPGQLYTWTKGANDTNLVWSGGTLTTTGTFTNVIATTVTLHGTASAAITATVIAPTWIDAFLINHNNGNLTLGCAGSTTAVNGTALNLAGGTTFAAGLGSNSLTVDSSGNVNVSPLGTNTGTAVFNHFICVGRNPNTGPISLDLFGNGTGFNMTNSGATPFDLCVITNQQGLVARWAGSNSPSDGSYLQLVGNIAVATAGNGLRVKEGSNAKQGTFTLNGTTTVNVGNTSVTSSSRIIMSQNLPNGGTASGLIIPVSITAGTGFAVKSAALDTSICAYEIFEPA